MTCSLLQKSERYPESLYTPEVCLTSDLHSPRVRLGIVKKAMNIPRKCTYPPTRHLHFQSRRESKECAREAEVPDVCLACS
jgi:hypothetical protein